MRRVRHTRPERVSYQEVLQAFRDPLPYVACRAPVLAASTSRDPFFPRVLRCRVGDTAIDLHFPPELAACADERFASGRVANMVLAVAARVDRSHRFYRDLVVAAGYDPERFEQAVRRRVSFYLDDRASGEVVARAGPAGLYLGHRTLLAGFGQIIHHELFHLVARRLVKSGEAHFFSSTALNEALADYYTAVAYNQPHLSWPADRRVKNQLSEAADGLALRGSHHQYGQLLGGLLWDLRKAVNRSEGRAWGEISYVDRLALVAFAEDAHELRNETTDLRGWIELLQRADRRLSGGRYAELLRRLGARRLGAPPAVTH